MSKPENKTSDVDEHARRLQASIAERVAKLRSSDEWVRHLAFTASFHQYSLNNILLIAAQCPHATQVAGYRAWQDKGRQVRKGEQALKIFGRSTKAITDSPADDERAGNAEQDGIDRTTRTLVRYPVLSVFDISQTDPIPGRDGASSPAKLLTGEDPAGILVAVTSHLSHLGWTVRHEPIQGTANGYATTDGTRQVVIDSSLAPAQAAKTGLHEDAHVTLGHPSAPGEYAAHRGLMETEAESVAYVLAGLFGLETADYSIGYIASWTDGDSEIIKTTATNVLRAVHTMAPALQERLGNREITAPDAPQQSQEHQPFVGLRGPRLRDVAQTRPRSSPRR